MKKTTFDAVTLLRFVSDEDLTREYMRRHNERRRKTPPRPKVLRPCEWCGEEFGAREMRGHIPQCSKRQETK